MSKRIVKLSESDIKKHIKKVISEQPNTNRQQAQFGGQQQRGQGQIPPPQNQTPPPQRGPKKRAPKRTTTPTVDKNDLTGDNKGEGVNLYNDEAQKELRYSATIDKIAEPIPDPGNNVTI